MSLSRRPMIVHAALGGLAVLSCTALAMARPPAAEPFTTADSQFGIGFVAEHHGSATEGPGLQSAADHIISFQCLDGGWGWPHTACPTTTFSNITGAISLGLLRIWEVTGDAGTLAGAVAGGDFDVAAVFPNATPSFGSFAPGFLHTLTGASGDGSYSTHAATGFFDRLTAGTYGDPTVSGGSFFPGDTYDYLDRHKSLRAGTSINLRPWDMQLMPWVAGLIGNAHSSGTDGITQQTTFLDDAVLDGLNTLEQAAFWDTLGLAGGIRGLALNGTTTFTALTSPLWSDLIGISDLCDLADVLITYQNADGSWSWLSTIIDSPSDQDTQTTAYAVLALAAADAAGCTEVPGGRYTSEIAAGRAWLASMQDVDGGFFTWPGSGVHNIEVDAEAAHAATINALSLNTSACSTSGTVTVTIDMSAMPDDIVGGQFFLLFDDSTLTFVSAVPGGGTFDVEVFEIVGAGTIAYAVGVTGGGPGTSFAETMAILTFTSVEVCTPTPDLVTWDHSHVPPTRLTNDVGDEFLPTLSDLGAVAVDVTDPVITCPADLDIECDEPVDPATVYGATGATTGGVAIYYNTTGPADLSNAAYLRTIVDLSNLNGAEFIHDSTDLTGIPGITWQSIFSGLAVGTTQFGLDVIRPLPTDDFSVVIPTLTAVDNVDGTPGGATPAGTVPWAINDYKPFSPSGPVTPGNAPTNSIVRGSVGGDPFVEIEIVELKLVGVDLSVRLKLDADDIIHWFTPATPDTPMPTFGLNGDFYLEGLLSPAGSAAGVDFFDGVMTVIANAPTASGFATATDNCTLFPAISFSDSVAAGSCPQEAIITRTWTATDDCGNSASCDQIITVVDTTGPVLADCPTDFTVPADAGGCDAVVTFTAPTATDNCDPSPTVVCVPPSGSVFPAGPTLVTCTATDACGNSSECTFTVTVDSVNDMTVAVELESVTATSITRCITFEFWKCPDTAPLATVEVDMTFLTGLAVDTIEIPCGDYACVTARDTLHTLRRTDVDDFGIVGTEYVADFTATGDGDALVGGNLNDDFFVDILDFGIFVGQFGDAVACDTPCSFVGPHADISGNCVVFSEDFTFISTSFLESHEANCCGAPLAMYPPFGPAIQFAPQPVTRISLAQLRRRGLGHLAIADLNHDGWLDVLDIQAFAGGARP